MPKKKKKAKNSDQYFIPYMSLQKNYKRKQGSFWGDVMGFGEGLYICIYQNSKLYT